jgi:hypothetical protein
MHNLDLRSIRAENNSRQSDRPLHYNDQQGAEATTHGGFN